MEKEKSEVRNKPKGEVTHCHLLSQHIGRLCLSPDYSDITLLVRGEKIPAHKAILATNSEYFRALFFGGLKESRESEVEINDVASLESFKAVLRYAYSRKIVLSQMKEEHVVDALVLCHKYGFRELEDAISSYTNDSLSIFNACLYYDAALLCGFEKLLQKCVLLIDHHTPVVLRHKSFLSLSPKGLLTLIERDSFFAPEADILSAVVQWLDRNNKKTEETIVQEILSKIRLPLMSLDELTQTVRPLKLLSDQAILDAIDLKTKGGYTEQHKYRGMCLPGQNVAQQKKAKILSGNSKEYLLNGDVLNYEGKTGYTWHHMDKQNPGIVIRLDKPYIINHIKLLLWDKDARYYSYYIEVSVDQKDWAIVADYRKFLCHSWQSLYFDHRIARYIRIIGTRNTINESFHVVHFECMYSEESFQIDPKTGLLIPRDNVATILNSRIIEGLSNPPNAMINGDWTNYTIEEGFTSHKIGSGAIVIKFAQPYIIESLRFLLWDLDSRVYSYYLQVSIDGVTWWRIHDRSRQSCRSWQKVTFPPLPVTFVRIIGTHSSCDRNFHVVHFECPLQEKFPRVIKSVIDNVYN